MQTVEKTRISLLERTRELLVNRPAPIKLKDIAKECDCSVSCLSHLIAGTEDPSVNLIQRLYEHLSGNQLQY